MSGVVFSLVKEEKTETGLITPEALKIQENSVICQTFLWERGVCVCVFTWACTEGETGSWGRWTVKVEAEVDTNLLSNTVLLRLWFPQKPLIENYQKSKCVICHDSFFHILQLQAESEFSQF